MPTLDFDRMRRTGLLSDEEYGRVKRKMVGQAAERLGQSERPRPDAGRSAAEKLALLGAAIDSEGLEGVLSPHELAEAEKARRLREAAEQAGGNQFDKYRDQPAEPRFLEGPGADSGPSADPFAGGAQANREADAVSEAFGALDPLARASAAAASEEERLKGMLKAGVISHDEYDEMKAFYEKKQRGG